MVRYIAELELELELELGPTDGPARGLRLIAATVDPTKRKPESTWSLATAWPLSAQRGQPRAGR